METITLLQHYWWLIISLLGALLVFLLFVQGGQGLLYCLGRTEEERNMLVNSLGRKWEFTFTTLVTFGGAFFASFPLFYSTSFGGAYYVWMTILLSFVIQPVAYQFRRKAGNVFGEKTFDVFLTINGIAGPLLLGTAVGTLFTGANFTVDRLNLANGAGSGSATVISQWTTPWHGLEALGDMRNVALGLAVMFLAGMLACQYFMNNIADETLFARARRRMLTLAAPFLLSAFLPVIFLPDRFFLGRFKLDSDKVICVKNIVGIMPIVRRNLFRFIAGMGFHIHGHHECFGDAHLIVFLHAHTSN